VPRGYDVKRIEEFNIPGPADLTALAGIAGAVGDTPMSISAPPGTGDGQGKAPVLADAFGIGHRGLEMVGGPGGLRYLPGGLGGRGGETKQELRGDGGNSIYEACVGNGLK